MITHTYTFVGGDFIDFDAYILHDEVEVLLGLQGEPEMWLIETNRSPDVIIIQTDDALDTTGLDALIASHGSQAGIDARAADALVEFTENSNLHGQLTNLVDSYSFAQLETMINSVFGDHTAGQRNVLLQLSRILLYLAKNEGRTP